MTEETGALETKEDAGKGASGVVHRWKLELELSDKVEKDWRKRGKDTLDRYRDEKNNKTRTDGTPKFNVLYSNTSTMIPALYGKTPAPDIRRRYRDNDPVGKVASEVLERSVEFTLDDGVFDQAMFAAVFDRCLPGRAVTRVRYVPSISEGGEGQDGELLDEAITYEPWPWEDFRRGPARRWEDVPWVAFRHWMTIDGGVKEFGEGFRDVEADAHPEGEDDSGPDSDTFKRVEVWEIWDKEEKKVLFIALKHESEPLKEISDPLGLKGFFPIPKPLYAIEDSRSLVPVEEFRMYRDQAEELDRLTQRIAKLIEVLKFRGIADSRIAELWNTENLEDGEFVPAEDVTQFLAGGGIENAIWILPLEKMITVLRELYVARDAVKQTIYEISGISDILRGASDAGETATAQGIKAQWGSIRMQKAQRDVQRYARDLIRIAVEIIAERFQVDTLKRMTGVQVPMEAELQAQAQQIQQQAMVQAQQMAQGQDPQKAQQAAQQVIQQAKQESQKVLSGPSWEKISKVLKSDVLRGYRVDIETDSTIEADEQADKEARIELVSAITQSLAGGLQIVSAAPELAPLIKETLLFTIRGFKDGRALESSIEESMDKAIAAMGKKQQAQGQPDPTEQLKAQTEQVKAQATQAKAQADIKKTELGMQGAAQDAQFKQQEHQFDVQKLQADIEKMKMDMMAAAQKHQAEMEMLAAKVHAQHEMAESNNKDPS